MTDIPAAVTIGFAGFTANTVTWPCGCRTWDEWDAQECQWVHRASACGVRHTTWSG